MATTSGFEPDWSALLARIGDVIDLEATARASGALVRRRAVGSAAALLRLALGYGPGGMSLRSAAAWAEMRGISSLSDVALMKRLQGAADWLGLLAGALMGKGAQEQASVTGRRLRIVDGSVVCHPAHGGLDWRLHAIYEPARAAFTHVELTDARGWESLTRLPVQPGDVVVGDRGFARPPELKHVLEQGADFVVRIGWRSLRLLDPGTNEPIDLESVFAHLRPGEHVERPVLIDRSKPRGRPLFSARVVILRKSPASGARDRRRAKDKRRRRATGHRLLPMTMAAADYLMVLTSLPLEVASDEVLKIYRVRWQIELAFKRLKSLVGIDRLAAKDSRLARAWLYAHLIIAFLISDASQDLLAPSPSGPGGQAAALALAHP